MTAHSQPQRIRLGDLLISQQVITPEQLQEALQAQKDSGQKLGQALISLGFVDERTVLEILSRQLNIPFVDLHHYNIEPEQVRSIPETVARRFRVIVLGEENGKVVLGMCDPADIFAIDDVSRRLGKEISPVAVVEAELLDSLDMSYGRSEQIQSLAAELDEVLSEATVDISNLINDVPDSDAPVARLLESIFEEAIKTNASDIHIEPEEKILRIRQRIDGMLSERIMNERRIAGALVVRLKLLAGLDISEKRLPQDGRFHIKVKGRDIDLRMSTMPVQYGESVVLRILNHADAVLSLNNSGMPERMVGRFRDFLHRPNGLVLVTGPTGSGKTTTLYSGLTELNTADKKIITVEDPVEYRLPRVNQVQINEKIGLTFAKVLRATLRQDPDVLLVGEIRDRESAEIAMRAAMTGHLVLSTLHTNDACSSPLRLVDMGVDPYLVASSLKAVVAQRLLRRLCDKCAKSHQPDAGEKQLIEMISKLREIKATDYRTAVGCPHCFNTGYRGRVGAFEWLEVNDEMADHLRENNSRGFLKAVHQSRTFRPLSVSAMEYAEKGITSLSEVMRVSAQLEDEQLTDVD
ncbi:MAG: GspE/PulE family protein [Porticoccaceae bacterium]|nr:Flp pilus assembly complex ATPase component TadA [Pseudomonadales bacterium]MCP5172634.1 Flp pilus assembly complex ATPase component TadA [Pseudomonadales bacterium]MCP5302108.1 Flp pilus assembly complex ATPase component TadA [Pseudomonadales bacterium]